jgi:glycerol-3-phosphate acyltransferase PlsY
MVAADHGSLLPQASLRNLMALAALCAVLGHLFPVWLGFHGGKGVATGFGVFLVAAPWAALAAISVFFLVLLLSRYVSLASVLGAASFPVFAWFLVHGDRPPFFIAVQIAVALLIIAKHHQNIRRLLAGTESRLGANSGEKRPA